MSSERVRKRQQQRKRSKSGSSGSFAWFWGAIVVVVSLFALTFLLTQGEPSGAGDDGEAGIQEIGPVAIDGDALPRFDPAAGDEAVGLRVPVLTGETFEGDPIEIGTAGRPTVVVFLAHWCPHCQAEVPRVKAFIDEGRVPEGIDIVSVATGTSNTQANYPPSAWLERGGWQPEVMVDEADGVAADAYGLSAFPYFVFLNADGTVNARASGEVEMERFAAMLANLE